jgi:DNA-directed RNA polymerase subunit RPC12/RpoP
MTKTIIVACQDCGAKHRDEIDDNKEIRCQECLSKNISLEEIELK